tara:strand:+ start:82 stop:243 length:162 start_codon:yes stop_codon:yes gene_type:complete
MNWIYFGIKGAIVILGILAYPIIIGFYQVIKLIKNFDHSIPEGSTKKSILPAE